jgi:hypothetical protein
MAVYKRLLSIILLCIVYRGFGQQSFIPSGSYFSRNAAFELNRYDKPVHSGFKPLLYADLNDSGGADTLFTREFNTGHFYEKHGRSLIVRKLLYEDFVKLNKPGFSLYVNPLFYLEKGSMLDTVNYFINTRGIEIKGDIGSKFSFYSSFRENQARFRNYIYQRIRERLVVPGQGAVKLNNRDISLFDFSSASAYISWAPAPFINIRIGQDKHFIGEGYRSLLLSDASSNYPFANIRLRYKDFNYNILFTEFRDFQNVYYDYHFKKHGAFNYLSYNYRNRFEIGLFEGMIYRTTDTIAGYANRFPADFFIPVPAVRSIVNGFGNEHHLILGIQSKVKVNDYIQLYGQAAIDNPDQKKYAYQAGLKLFDLFFSKIDRHLLYLQTEYNYASPRCYSHADNIFQTWSHYNEELAHPSGSGFSEVYTNLRYSYKRLLIDLRYQNLKLNKDGSYSDIFITDSENYIDYPQTEGVIHYTFNSGFIINAATALQVYIGFDRRVQVIEGQDHDDTFFMLGLRSDIANFYYDF